GDHPLEHDDVALDVFDDRFLVQTNRAAGSGTFGRSVGQFEGLFDLEVWQTLDFEDAAGEHVLLALLFDREQARLDRVVGNGVDQVTQGDAGLQLALEAHQYRFRHIERHDAGGRSKGHQTRTCGEADADGEAGVRVATGTDRVG